MILIELNNLRTDFSVRALYTRQHNPTVLLLITVLSLVRAGFILYSLFLGAWLFAKRNRSEPSCREYDRYIFLWLMALSLITSFTNFATPRWYTLMAASQIPALLLFYLIIPQHNFWPRIFPGLTFTVIQLVLYATYKTPPPVFGFVSVYVGYVLSNII
jgi:ABC-type Na+ efflux pump permease subunit